MRNLKVATKLFLLIGVFIVAMGAQTVIGYFSLTKLAEGTSEMYSKRLVPQAEFLKYRFQNQSMRTILFQSMQFIPGQEAKDLETNFENLKNSNTKILDKLLAAGITADEKKIVSDIKEEYSSYIETISEAFALGAVNRNKEAYDHYKKSVVPSMNIITSLGDKLENKLMASAATINESARKEADQSLLLSIILSVIASVICTIIGIIIIRMIVKPVQAVQNDMLQVLRDLFGQISETSQQVAAFSVELTANSEQTSTASETIATNVQEVAGGADQQVHAVEEMAKTLRQMGDSVQYILRSTQRMSETAVHTSGKSFEGNEAIHTAVNQMSSIHVAIQDLSNIIHGLEQQSEEIDEIVDAITEIAAQTNLLALNAAIEAARAGDHGRGFAVVAGEVRKLAEQSSGSANKISLLISTIQSDTSKAVQYMERASNEVSSGIETVNSAGLSFAQIEESVERVAGQIQEVSSEVHGLASGTEQVVGSVESINEVVQMTAFGTQNIAAATEEQLASMEEISVSSASLSHMAEDLHDKINKFKIYRN
ncbi:methyl-accepting chemotaxis protein [Paenibacillus sp.]|uniref:HAMP domain-containing methyl-accepting chemotaxis protein n=1 Tax=Paenibacillus sp. TaxID=58172 RepID=UPI0028A854EB|nr:methyl-accepting chemotaxis protein [Paenibacillus sp.]